MLRFAHDFVERPSTTHEMLARRLHRPHIPGRGQSRPVSGSEEHMLRRLAVVLAAVAALSLAGCGYNDLQRQDEAIRASWSEVVNQYQRRADLVPNLVNTVKGYAQQEQQVLTEVTNARAQVGSIRATPELINDPAAFQKFIQAQNQLQSALSRLIAVSENYPQLKSDALFRDLQSQLEGTENRIAVARNRYIKTVQEYNTTVRQFPTNLTAMIFKMNVKPNFTVADESAVSTPPKVDFGKPATPVAPATPPATTPPSTAPAPAPAAPPGAPPAPAPKS
jgi:LemA protein